MNSDFVKGIKIIDSLNNVFQVESARKWLQLLVIREVATSRREDGKADDSFRLLSERLNNKRDYLYSEAEKLAEIVRIKDAKVNALIKAWV